MIKHKSLGVAHADLPPPSVWAPHTSQPGSTGLQASNIYFEMLMSQLHPFILPSLPDRVSGTQSKWESWESVALRSGNMGLWGHHLAGRFPAGMFLEPPSVEPSRREALLSSGLLSSFYPQGADEATSGFKVQELLLSAKPASEP